ncbi:conserved exported hypothetical protein [Candidatus Sulfopaludibacter sp. SbA4]|nr:conserved exported hypothetical protein [Candidatus Sulfopaludibacter sp. SbA4]
MKTTLALLVIGLNLAPLRSQPQAAATPPEFEVASVKVSKFGNGVAGGCHGIDSQYGPSRTAPPPLGRCVITDARLSHLISIAYDLNSMVSIKSGPDWIARGDDRYNIEAKAAEPSKATEQQLLSMLQTLLADRFQLKFHRETVETPGFALVVAKNGPKLRESTAEEVGTAFSGAKKPMPGRPASLKARKYTMPMLANLLSRIGGHGPMMDKTGLSGAYDFTLSWDEDAGPALTTALNEQLGLRLESHKVPVSFLVVDSAQKPADN